MSAPRGRAFRRVLAGSDGSREGPHAFCTAAAEKWRLTRPQLLERIP